MARPCPTITLRRKRILRDAGLLLLSLAVLLVLFSFPYLTREQALWALKKKYFLTAAGWSPGRRTRIRAPATSM